MGRAIPSWNPESQRGKWAGDGVQPVGFGLVPALSDLEELELGPFPSAPSNGRRPEPGGVSLAPLHRLLPYRPTLGTALHCTVSLLRVC